LNLGLAWMVFANLFPLGVLQLADVVTNGYWHARSLEFFEHHTYIEWLRLPGDVIFIAGVVPLVYLTAKALLRPPPAGAPRDASGTALEGPLFTEVTVDASAR
jgi:nitric oxide reductase subunit B